MPSEPGGRRVIGPVPEGEDPEAYDRLRRKVLWSLPAGLYVVGSASGGTFNLMTCNWCQQVATEPKTVMVSVDTEAVTHRLVEAGGSFSVNLIDREDRALVRRFVKPVTEVSLDEEGRPQSLGGQEVRQGATGAPILSAALAWLDCEVRSDVVLGSHRVFFGEVVGVGLRPGVDEPAQAVLRMEDTRMSYGG